MYLILDYFSPFLVENECATETITATEITSSKKTGTRSKKNRKRGKRKPGGEVVDIVKNSASQDNKENHVGVNDAHIGLKYAKKCNLFISKTKNQRFFKILSN